MSRYDLFRRRIAPIAFAIAIAAIAYDTCDKQERTSATFVLDFGAAARDVRAVEAEVWMRGDRVAEFRRTAVEGAYIGKTQFASSLPDTSGELRIEVELAGGEQRNLVRQIHVEEGGTVTLSLEHDLR